METSRSALFDKAFIRHPGEPIERRREGRGYDMDTFGGMIHALKDEYSLRGDDNVTFHDSGDVYFNGEWLDNIHTYAP